MSLTSLPTELIEHIAAYLDLPTFRSFRLVCTSLNEESLHTFKDCFFRTRTLRWTKMDFERLIRIASHPVLGNALRNLIIDATPRHSISLWQLRRRISEADAVFSDPSGVFFKSELQEQYVVDEKAARDVMTFYTETRYDQKCLQAAFEKIPELDSIDLEFEGMDSKYSIGSGYCQTSQHEMSRPFVSTLTALAACHVQVKSISINAVKQYGAISIGRLESLSPSLKNFDIAFEKLEVLKLKLRDWRHPDTAFELETGRAPFVVRFLAKAKNVKTLYLSCFSNLGEDIFGEMARHCNFTKLEICHLSLFRIQRAKDLIDFLGASSTIRQLQLHVVQLSDREVTWQGLLRSLVTSEEQFGKLQLLDFAHLITISGTTLAIHKQLELNRVRLGSEGAPVEHWKEEALERLEDLRHMGWAHLRQSSAWVYPYIQRSIGPDYL